MGDELQDFVTHSLATAAAIRKDGVAHQDHAGARLVLVADFVYPGLLHQLSRSQYAVGLVKDCSVSWFHASLVVFLPGPRQVRAMLESNSAPADVMRSEWPQVGGCTPRPLRLHFYFQATPEHDLAGAFSWTMAKALSG